MAKLRIDWFRDEHNQVTGSRGVTRIFFVLRRRRERGRARDGVSPSRRGGRAYPEKILASRMPVDAIWAPLTALFYGVLEALFICKVNKKNGIYRILTNCFDPSTGLLNYSRFFYITHVRIVRNGRYALG